MAGGEEVHPRILVALFENRTGDESLDPVGLMAGDAIIQGLSCLNLGHVIPFTTVLETKRMASAMAAQPSDESPASRAEAMAANMVVDGAYYLEADTLSFLVNITDTQSTGLESQYIQGVCDIGEKLLILLDFNRILLLDEIRKLKSM